MFSPADFRELVSGRRSGVSASVARSLLRAAEAPYSLAVHWRNRRYDRGQANVVRVDAPVISVGNLTMGGTGKTPMVKWLARWFVSQGGKVAIVSRGYRAADNRPNDEALELRQSLPDVPHVQNADRVAAARAAIAQHRCDVILLDDGFQHRRLGRDLDIVLLDALEPFGFDHVFPRGTLREPLHGLRRADVVCLSRADAVAPALRATIRERVLEIAPQVIWSEIRHAPSGLTSAAGNRQSLEALRGQRAMAFCGIGNPAGFRHTLTTAGCEIVAWREFPDHHAYNEADIANVRRIAEQARADVVVCTQKDLVKIVREHLGGRPLWAVTIEIAFLAGQDGVEQALRRIKSRES